MSLVNIEIDGHALTVESGKTITIQLGGNGRMVKGRLDIPRGSGIEIGRLQASLEQLPAAPTLPAVCSNQWLRTKLDADGKNTSYTLEDSSDLFQ